MRINWRFALRLATEWAFSSAVEYFGSFAACFAGVTPRSVETSHGTTERAETTENQSTVQGGKLCNQVPSSR